MRKSFKISDDFFCDGHYYLLTSQSLGGSNLTAKELSEILFEANDEKISGLLDKGICLPVCFPGDCAFDGQTLFVLGDLSEQEEHDWIARLVWKLNVPCGKLILCCGCLDSDLAPAVAGVTPDKNYMIYEVFDVPPAEYLVEIYAYLESQTVAVSLDEFDDDGNYSENDEMAQWYRQNRPGDDLGYVIRLTPLENDPPKPKLFDGCFEEFEFRPVDL